ncbi:MAG TPA: hypothetical protein VEI97_14715 [bacterium]|nr:hypothetical protein [bacterium]
MRWLSKTTVCDRFTLRGVPAKQIYVLAEQAVDLSVQGDLCVEIGRKLGRYDREETSVLTIRRFRAGMPAPGGTATILATESEVQVDLQVVGGASWRRAFRRLRSDLNDYSAERLILWHFWRYYTHLLPELEEVQKFAATWTIPGGMGLAEANRCASRCLYDLSRALGWRKLTLRERGKLGFDEDAAQWQRISECERRYSVTLCGEATTCSSYGMDE